MRIGIAALVLGYVLSQFYRAFLAVLTPALQQDLGASAAQLADASGMWFLTFALMQIPIGHALDRIGPRRTAAVILALGGGGGALIFATATSGTGIVLAMGLIGIGCAPVLMASFFLFARLYSPAVFGTLAGVLIGVGNLGNLGAALPLSLAAEAFGWRGTVLALAVVTLLVAVAIWLFVKDPPVIAAPEGGQGGMLQILRQPALWAVLVMLLTSYVPAAAIRGLWAGPYFAEIYGLSPAAIGTVTLVMGLAMVAGNFAYGPADRWFGTRKGAVLGGNLVGLLLLLGLWWQPAPPYAVAVALIAGIGFCGMAFPLLMAHGRAYFPPHLVGRGVTLLNLFGIGGVGALQMVSGRVYDAVPEGAPPAEIFGVLFGFFAIVLAVGCLAYAFSRDRID